MTCCEISTYSQTAEVVEKLSDGSYVVKIDGVEHRAFSADRVREMEKRKIDLDGCREELSIRADTSAQWKSLYEGEHTLRLRADTLIQKGKIARFFDNPWVKIFADGVVPVATFLLTVHK
jgi:hypothetical protein